MPVCSRNLRNKLGFFNEDEADNFSLKCTPCFFNARNCVVFPLAIGSGDPGGDGGISRLGAGGRVKSCIRAREAVYGEDWPVSCSPIEGSTISEGCSGPRTGPFIGLDSNGGASICSAMGSSIVCEH